MKKTLLTAALAASFATGAMAQDAFKWQPFYTQTYENVAQVGDVWNCPNNQGGLSLVEDENGNHYVKYNHGNNNSRGLYNVDALSAEMYEGIDEYRVEFDLALTSGSNQFSQFNLLSTDYLIHGGWNKDGTEKNPTSNINSGVNNGIVSGSLFSLFQESASTEMWRVYSQGPVGSNNWMDNEDITKAIYVTLSSGAFYHFAITVTPHEVTDEEGWNVNIQAEIQDADGNMLEFQNGDAESLGTSVTLPYTDGDNGFWFSQFYSVSGRYNSVMMIDNVQVMKKVAAGSVTPPTLSMTGVQMEGRIIALDNGAEADALMPFYALVDESTYEAAESAEGLTGTEYTGPFVVSEEMNYILAWNVDENGKASELTKFTVEAGWAPQLNAPSISAIDYKGYKKTYVASCYQGDVKPLAPQAYTIYMSQDSIEWVATDTLTVKSGLVYAKVEADGYVATGCEGVEVPDGVYGCTKWTCVGAIVTPDTTPEDFAAFDVSKGRVAIDPKYWNEDEADYAGADAWSVLKGLHIRTGSDDFASVPTNGGGTLFAYVPKDGSGVVSGIAIYGKNHVPCYIEGLQEGDIVRVVFDSYATIYTVEDPENFSFEMPVHGGGMLVAVEIKGAGTVETREAKAGEWGIICSNRTVADVEQAGATFYEHVYTIYNGETYTADTLLLQPVNSLQPGVAYLYKADADQLELVTLAAEEPVDEQDKGQLRYELETFYATLDEPYEDTGLYTMQPGGILMKNDAEITVPEYSGFFQYLDDVDCYLESLDYKLQPEYETLLSNVQSAFDKAVEDYKNEGYYDEDGSWWPTHEGDMSEEEMNALYDKTYADKFNAQLGKYTIIPVVHVYNQDIANAINKVQAEALVNVVTPSGVTVRRGVKASEALNGLKSGLYIVGSKKVVK